VPVLGMARTATLLAALLAVALAGACAAGRGGAARPA
jgi:hypothetical protein